MKATVAPCCNGMLPRASQVPLEYIPERHLLLKTVFGKVKT